MIFFCLTLQQTKLMSKKWVYLWIIKKLNDLNKWYHHSRLAIIKLEDKVQGYVKIGKEQKDFLGMTRNEIKAYFQKLQDELEMAYVFKIISATEGILRQDFNI